MNITDVKTDSPQYMPPTNMPLPKTALLKPNLEAIIFDTWVGMGTGDKPVCMKVTVRNHSDLNIRVNGKGDFLVTDYFLIHPDNMGRYINIYHLENHPKIICYETIDSVFKRFFFNEDVIFPSTYQIIWQELFSITVKQDNDDIIPKISEECYQKKAAVRQLLLSLEDENSAFSQNGILKDIIILIGEQFAILYQGILQDQSKKLDSIRNVVRIGL